MTNYSLENSVIRELGSYLAERIESFGQITSMQKFSDGQSNPTYKMTTTHRDYVLRSKPPGKLLKSAHAVDREFRVICALKDTAVPTPEAFCLCEGENPLGVDFFVMEFVDGNIHWNPSLPNHLPLQRRVIFGKIAEVVAALHSVNVQEVGLSDFGRPGNYFERQVTRWETQYLESIEEPDQGMASLISWLKDNKLSDDGISGLVHGDLRIDNLIFSKDDKKILAILDWELSTLGHPLADLAYICMQWRMPSDGQFLPGLGGLSRPALGIPTEEEFLHAYCSARGIPGIPRWNYYIAFSYFRLISILQGVVYRAALGNASNPQGIDHIKQSIPILIRDAVALI
ncbi:phosphotransferase (plasmid) [Aminobacter sp. SR38]|jgi:aminoglycoside phosphotransferase (APT) family kinase protein|uniref:phosphotransferase n=1 Tax=Aminobacter sp. SR38 TaxID=2774562 RepID=UPI001780D87F|nr:phosphotransferase [Aminobacter sp. SR38]QOF75498.1 phosphotransferase [Aminobacter sp. SR38]